MTIFVFLLLLGGDEQSYEVKQVAADVVYLDLEGKTSLTIGDRLAVLDGSQVKADLEVIGISQKFAACKILNRFVSIKPGDRATGTALAKEKPHKPKRLSGQRKRSRTAAVKTGQTYRRSRKPIRGTVGLQFYGFFDQSGRGNNVSQPGLRLNLRGSGLQGGIAGFRVRTRARYDIRDNTSPESTAWKTRIYEAVLQVGRDDSRFHYKLGRLISDALSGVGYIDGALLEARVGKNSRLGVFAGNQPRWQSAADRETINKYGAYYRFTRGDYQSSLFDSTIAVAGEYHGSTISREFLSIRNRFSKGSRFSLFQSAELDINRDWRQEKAGNSLELSNLYVTANWRLNEVLNWSFGYDNRSHYFTYEIRNEDQLRFEDMTRQGYRTNLSARFQNGLRLNGGYGLREREGEDPAATWTASLYHNNLVGRNWTLRARFNGFTNPNTRGLNSAIRFGKRWRRGHQLSLGYSLYDYHFALSGEDRANSYIMIDSYILISQHWHLNGRYELNQGDDTEGHRLYLEIGFRL